MKQKPSHRKNFSSKKRFRLMQKSDEEILLEILVLSEKHNSFCPENLIVDNISLFEEAYCRFNTWDGIIERCVSLSNVINSTAEKMKTPKEVILEILKLENSGQSLDESENFENNRNLHSLAILFFGSWEHLLSIAGIRYSQ